MPALSIDVLRYDGSLAALDLLGSNNILINDLVPVTGTMDDSDALLEQSDDGTATFEGAVIDYVGGGTGSILSVFSEPLGVFTANGETFLFFPEGVPPLSGLLLTTNISAGTPTPVCFLSGTCIDTPSGPRSVELLAPGDCVLTADGGAVAVKFIHRQTVSTFFGPAERLMPVQVRAGSLGQGRPLRDLVLTANHGLMIDGLIINAGALVNGDSIDWVPLNEFDGRYTVYHVETENHEIILAEGVAAETFVDYAGRKAFDNYDAYVALYGHDRTVREAPYPRVSTARLVPPEIRARLSSSRVSAA